MAIKLISTAKTIKEKVIVERRGDLGKIEKSEFVGEFLRLNSDEREDFAKENEKFAEENLDAKVSTVVHRWMSKVLVNCTGVEDEDGNKLEFSDELLLAMVKDVDIRSGLIEAWGRVNQLKELRQKN